MKLVSWSERVSGEGLDRLVPLSAHEYHDWPEVTGLFPWSHSGCQLKRTWPIAESKSVLQRRWRTLLSSVPRRRNELMRATDSRNAVATPQPIAGGGRRLRSLNAIGRDGSPEGIERYGYRSFDRQWIIADNRLADRSRPDLWRVRGRSQVFLTTLTSTKLGWGPVLTVSPYVPDLHHFRGSYGAKNVMPLYRGPAGETGNITEGILTVLGDVFDTTVTVEDLMAYVYGLGGTAAFSDRFGDQLAELAGPVRIPITVDTALLDEAVTLGRDLLWWHTWGERFAPKSNVKLPAGRASEVAPVTAMPQDLKNCRYDPDTERLTVGTGIFAPVSQEVWDFEVSGLRVLPSWLGYRMKNRKGKKSSELDDIRPTRWTQTKELLLLLSILEHTVEVTPQAADLLDRIVDGPLIPAADLPTPTPAARKPPRL